MPKMNRFHLPTTIPTATASEEESKRRLKTCKETKPALPDDTVIHLSPRRSFGFESKSPSALKRTIIEALRYSQNPLNLGQIVNYVRQSHNFSSDSSLDELIYNTLFDLCSAKMAVKVIGTAAKEIRYLLPDQTCSCAINLTFHGELSHEQYNKPSQASERAWTTLRRTNQYHPESLKYAFNKTASSTRVEFPCIPVTDSMIYESFATRAGIKTSMEGLQRPNTPIDGSTNNRISWECVCGDTDKPAREHLNVLKNDKIFSVNNPRNEDEEILGTRSLQNKPATTTSGEGSCSLSESTLTIPQNSTGAAETLLLKKQDKTIKHLNLLKEIADILHSHESSRCDSN